MENALIKLFCPAPSFSFLLFLFIYHYPLLLSNQFLDIVTCLYNIFTTLYSVLDHDGPFSLRLESGVACSGSGRPKHVGDDGHDDVHWNVCAWGTNPRFGPPPSTS